jgi:ABC-type multidrug transport system ATPase subunit
MLCGDEMPTSGHALLAGCNANNQTDDVRRLIGYCPQYDALHDLMTAREHLYFYGRIRGVSEQKLEATVEVLLRSLSLTEYADRPSGGYSGGNKRKLSVAVCFSSCRLFN